MKRIMLTIVMGAILTVIMTACSGGGEAATLTEPSPTSDFGISEDQEQSVTDEPNSPNTPPAERELEIITLLPRDGIPAIDNPTFLNVEEADQEYEPEELVIGVEFNGDARAYSIPLLSSHEIVNDTVGGQKIAVTW